ncbi:LytTR family DNA-binding domain-containing protein [Candidatus Stoquefichus massiliensis]|uniref:LytTR family DNA-binding domain-containing protein n=1 Tax=Candidatus Stoquefichus massiliensis TaxID=1470350 RepID=UPI000486404C|nr:LytTR family DNA-binding domain-containing protein [Candidatus Stoquefichus massiliensis]
MKIKVEEDAINDDIEVIIRCQSYDERVQKIINQLGYVQKKLNCKKDKEHCSIFLSDIFYIESIDEKTFIYAIDNVYESQEKLYMLENQLSDDGFIRISKSCLMNLDTLKSVKAMLNGKYEATLINDEKLIINRSYMRSFKKVFGIERGIL